MLKIIYSIKFSPYAWLLSYYPSHIPHSNAKRELTVWGGGGRWAAWRAQQWTVILTSSHNCATGSPISCQKILQIGPHVPSVSHGVPPPWLRKALAFLYNFKDPIKTLDPLLPPICKCCTHTKKNRCSSFYSLYSPVAHWSIAGQVQELRV